MSNALPTQKIPRFFNRKLSDIFMVELMKGGQFNPILVQARSEGLDVKIRSGYINIYSNGASILKLEETGRHKSSFKATIHAKYLENTCLGNLKNNSNRKSVYIPFDASQQFVSAYLNDLKMIISNALHYYQKKEAHLEEQIIKANNKPGSPILLIDRQIQDPLPKDSSLADQTPVRADLIGLTQDTFEPEFVLIELKQGSNNDIQDLPEQIGKYFSVMVDHTGNLNNAMWDSYNEVIVQSKKLEILPQNTRQPKIAPKVIGLIVLYDYTKGELWNRCLAGIPGFKSRFPYTIQLFDCCLGKNQYNLQSKSQWQPL